MFNVKIPFMRKDEDSAALRWVLSETAKQCEMTPYDVAVVLTYLCENIARAVCKGMIVRIPGFGLFGGFTWWPRKKNSWERDTSKASYCYPRFTAAKSFVNEVSLMCLPNEERNARMSLYRRNHNVWSKSVSTSETCRVFTCMNTFRQTIRKDARKHGLPCIGDEKA